MRNLNAERAGVDVHLSSMTPTSVNQGYHKTWGWVKRTAPTATSWGWGGADGIVELTKGKLSDQFGRLLHND